ncbi:MAG: SDR family oxidoreductase [Anaerolineales bacterium]|nr:SDR family oxidoreductase [Anaerolineales bacterium]
MSQNANGSSNVHDLFDLSGQIAVVTGGAGDGCGAQIVRALAETGATVIITSRNSKKAHKKAAQYAEDGLLVEGRALELCDEQNIQDLIKYVVGRYSHIDILFNNAAANHLEPFDTISIEDWNKVLSINITGTMLMSRCVAPYMLKQNKGVIVNISSIYGLISPDQRIYGNSGLNSPLVYGITKAAIIQMTKFMATYWAPYIRVNCIVPGGLYNNQDPEFVENYIARTPLGRMGGLDDLKGAAVYLASEASAWVTGQNIIVDGGWTTW